MGFEIRCLPVWDQSKFCCCSCSIRTGAIIVGWLAVLGNLSMSLRSIASLASGTDTAVDPKEEEPYNRREIYISLLVSNMVGLLIDSLSLYGIYKEKPTFMLPQIILEFIGYIVITIAIIIITILMAIYVSGLGALAVFLIGFAVMAFSMYLYIIRYSYYRQLEERRKPIESAPY